ncbi:VCBS repeat-containing protein [Algoriphagus hitonicola]|uniref:Repeat domain-containing protein n=1 Tax=Algoriphagus hitonicola TaxID=435880 RepID=A0A1I2U7M0_9BACT|nr:VCBS repeat-containing protein [Algoriphagus hitonicola]SFG73124.1 Repeat domain-containing protein [Algoriphagus hitonicola]
MKYRIIIFLLSFNVLLSCTDESEETATLFSPINSDLSGIDFRNDLFYTEEINPYTFRNFYNGAGVALGDINNDGLIDIFFAGNQCSNRLYLNEGNFKFKDITNSAGLESIGYWTTGVSMADINGDGLIDIYLCKSGPPGGEKRHNELFINQGDLTFKEMSKSYGLNDQGLSQHAVFFDYDKDGDLDFYLLSNSGRSVGIYDLREGQREIRDPDGGNKLYRNEGDYFTDVSEEAGIYGSSIGYGLGVTVADLNGDNWPDLYVSNDFFERDYLYLNNQDGTFREILPEAMPEISLGSMGADIADLDNDGLPDVFVTEMLPEDLARVKTKTPFEEWDKFQANFDAGYHRQFTRNTLQKNLGKHPETGEPIFAEISRLTGMHATDWSWGALIFDADLDGWKDVFVANGIVKDLTDFDFVDFYLDKQQEVKQNKSDSLLITKMIDEFPSNPLQNYWFKNLGNWNFENRAASSGLDQSTFSSGAAYGDLDNDGDLDLVVNNLNSEAGVFKNMAIEQGLGNYLKFDLGSEFGAKITLKAQNQTFTQEYQAVKGYMSSVDPLVHFGLGNSTQIDSIIIDWPNNLQSILTDIPTNQTLKLTTENTQPPKPKPETLATLLSRVSLPLDYRHQESDFIDFDRDRLRFWAISNEGPKGELGDLNSDGLMDLLLPGAKGFPSQLFFQNRDGSFTANFLPDSEKNKLSEDIGVHFFDANQDSHLDILVYSGSIEFGEGSPFYQDRLYLNDGKGNFSEVSQTFSSQSTSFALSLDWDRDGDLDLILGQRAAPFHYGEAVGLGLWENQGNGKFTEVNTKANPALSQIGMITSGALADLDQDGLEELILAGEWMGIKIFQTANGQFEDITKNFGLVQTRGLWNSLLVEDLNEDGLPDILAGNIGLNSRLNSRNKFINRMFINDFDQNGSWDPILTRLENGRNFPLLTKNALIRQLPYLRKQLTTYAAYQDKTMEELFFPIVLSNSLILELDLQETSLWLNNGKGGFDKKVLPIEVQFAPIYAINHFQDSDGESYLVLGGNQSRIKPELGSNLGSYGWVLKQTQQGEWKALYPEASGMAIPGEIRDFEKIQIENKPHLLVLRNDQEPILFKIR